MISQYETIVNIYESIGEEMAVNKYTEARRRANEKYNAKAYEEIKVRVPKGKKEVIKTHAESNGESLNGFVNRAIDEAMKKDSKKE